MTKNIKKLVILNIPYILVGLVCTNLGEAWRIAQGSNASEKVQSLILDGAFGAAFANPMPSFIPFDLLIGALCGGAFRLAVYLKGKNAKKYRHNQEYGSARWDAYYLLKELLYGRRRRKHYDPIQQDYRAVLPPFSR